MSNSTQKPNRIYMSTIRSTINPAVAASVFKVYDAKGTADFHFEFDRSWKSHSGKTGYSKKFYTGHAEAIAEVAELAEASIYEAKKGGFAIGRKLTEKLSEKLSSSQMQAITIENYRVLEEEFAHIKERGENSFWQKAIEAVVEIKQ